MAYLYYTLTTPPPSPTPSAAPTTLMITAAPPQRARRGNMVTASEIAAYGQTFTVSCDEIWQSVEYLDAQPFARGYSKAAWRAVVKNRSVVVKRAAVNDSSGEKSFFQSLKQEMKFLIRMGRHPHVMQYYGSCHQSKGPRNALVAEGPLVAMRAVMALPALTLAARLQIAVGVAGILELLQQRRLIHCDWKADQVAVHADTLTAKLVDLKSLRFHDNRPWLSTKPCAAHSECRGTCFKWLAQNDFVVPDLRCERDVAHCRGLDSASMMHASAQLFFWPLLQQHSPHTRFATEIRQLLQKCMHSDPQQRLGATQLKRALQTLQREAGSVANDDVELVRNEGMKFWSTAAERCKKRFC